MSSQPPLDDIKQLPLIARSVLEFNTRSPKKHDPRCWTQKELDEREKMISKMKTNLEIGFRNNVYRIIAPVPTHQQECEEAMKWLGMKSKK